jgi:shikimate kinase
MTKQNRIFIVGRSGAGKGVLAQAVAKKLGWKFINADILGCLGHIGREATDVIGTEGVEKLNHCLVDILRHQQAQGDIVVTTDENIVCSEEAREILKNEFAVHVTVSTPIQLDRLSKGAFRPLLPVDNLTSFMNEASIEQDTFCSEVATFSLSSDNGQIEEHVQAVVNAFNE